MASSLLDAPFGHIIDGKLTNPQGAKTIQVINPATEKSIASVPVADQAILDSAVKAARKAFPAWRDKSWDERADAIRAWGSAYKAQIPALSDLLIAEQGKGKPIADFETNECNKWFEETPKMRLDDEVLVQDSGRKVYKRYAPIGVAGLLVPWNFPVLLMVWKLIPCLLTGNCAIVKPSPFTPLCSIRIVEEAAKHFPPGVVQIVVGDDGLGPMITAHPGIDKISFTGSTATGRLVARSCAATLKRLTLELGGNDVSVIAPDVDIESVAPQVTFAATMCSAQFCCASKRIYVHASIYDKFSAAMVEAAKNHKMGPGDEEGVMIGPLNNKQLYEKVGEFFADSKKNGHKFLNGGEVPKGTGFFVPISFVDNPAEDSKIVREEPFGPIVPLLKWEDEEDLIKRVNDSEWGLGASVWCKDVKRAESIGRRIEAGMVWINETQNYAPNVPFGGWKQSGIGSEHGSDGLKSYCLVQSIHLNGL